jgi:hypothetical protein
VASELSSRTAEKRAVLSTQAYIFAAVALIAGGGLFYYLHKPSAPPPQLPLTPEARAYVGNLKLSDVDMKATESYFNQVVVEISGKITNAGDRGLDEVEIYCVFSDSYGQLVLRKRVPIVGGRMGGLKPGDTKSFRLPFDELPDSWNHAMPHLVIAGIKFS